MINVVGYDMRPADDKCCWMEDRMINVVGWRIETGRNWCGSCVVGVLLYTELYCCVHSENGVSGRFCQCEDREFHPSLETPDPR